MEISTNLLRISGNSYIASIVDFFFYFDVTCDLWSVTCDLRPVTCDLRPVTCDLQKKPVVAEVLMGLLRQIYYGRNGASLEER